MHSDIGQTIASVIRKEEKKNENKISLARRKSSFVGFISRRLRE